jgi:hypothetical protein
VVNDDLLPTDMVFVTVTAAEGTPAAGSHSTTPIAAGTARPIRTVLPRWWHSASEK